MNDLNRLKPIVIFIITIVFTGCAGNLNQKYLTGSWSSDLGNNTDFVIKGKNIQFFEDIDNGINCQGTYTLNNNLFTTYDCEGHLIANCEIVYLDRYRMEWKTENGNILTFFKRAE